MIGVTEPPFICPRCGLLANSLTEISRHDLQCAPPRSRKGNIDLFVGSTPLGARPVKKLKVGTKGKALNCPPPYCLIEASPYRLQEPEPPAPSTPPAPEPRTPRWSWWEIRVLFFIKLFALSDYWMARHIRSEARRG